jgi:hypothetical protein
MSCFVEWKSYEISSPWQSISKYFMQAIKRLKLTMSTKGKFHQPTGTRGKCSHTQSWVQKIQLYFINRIAPNSTGAKKTRCYRVCQGLWPSLAFADENVKLKKFWASSKSQVATTFLCMQFCSNYIGWSNQGKYYEIEMHCAKQDVAV